MKPEVRKADILNTLGYRIFAFIGRHWKAFGQKYEEVIDEKTV